MSLLEIFLTFWCCLILKIERMHHAVPLSDLLSGPVCSLQLHTAAFHFRHLFKDQRAASTTLWKRARVQPVETQVLSIMVMISPTMFILTANCCYWPVLCIGTHRAAVILPQLLACILNQIWYILTVFVCKTATPCLFKPKDFPWLFCREPNVLGIVRCGESTHKAFTESVWLLFSDRVGNSCKFTVPTKCACYCDSFVVYQHLNMKQ